MDTPPSFPNDTQQTHQKRKQGCKIARELKEGRARAGEQGAPTEWHLARALGLPVSPGEPHSACILEVPYGSGPACLNPQPPAQTTSPLPPHTQMHTHLRVGTWEHHWLTWEYLLNHPSKLVGLGQVQKDVICSANRIRQRRCWARSETRSPEALQLPLLCCRPVYCCMN